jgi:hypothetical protein
MILPRLVFPGSGLARTHLAMQERLIRDKRSSLFDLHIGDGEKRFITLTSRTPILDMRSSSRARTSLGGRNRPSRSFSAPDFEVGQCSETVHDPSFCS